MGEKLIFGVIGLFLGGIGGFFIGGAVCANQYKKTIESLRSENDILKEEIKQVKDEKLAEREKAIQKAEIKYYVDEIIKKEGYSGSDPEDENKSEDEEADEDDFDSDEDVDFDDPFENDLVKDGEQKGFRLLTEEQYEEDVKYMESESLTFYQQDKILADAFDEMVKNGTNIVGAEALKKAETTNENYIYVSDDDEEKLYEIEVNHIESFYRDAQR